MGGGRRPAAGPTPPPHPGAARPPPPPPPPPRLPCAGVVVPARFRPRDSAGFALKRPYKTRNGMPHNLGRQFFRCPTAKAEALFHTGRMNPAALCSLSPEP